MITKTTIFRNYILIERLENKNGANNTINLNLKSSPLIISRVKDSEECKEISYYLNNCRRNQSLKLNYWWKYKWK